MNPATSAKIKYLPLAALFLSLLTDPLHAAWPEKVFAPYMYIGAGDNFKLTDCDDACGLKYYTLAFIIARQDGERKGVIETRRRSRVRLLAE